MTAKVSTILKNDHLTRHSYQRFDVSLPLLLPPHFRCLWRMAETWGWGCCWAISWLNSTTLVLYKYNHFYLSIWSPRIKNFKDILSLNTGAYTYSAMFWVLWIILWKYKMIPFQGTYLIGNPGHTFKLSLIISDGSQREELELELNEN